MMTIITPFGRYRYLRMPFGINSATEVFQDGFEEIFGDIEGVDIYIDDVRIKAKNQVEHNVRLEQVLERAEQRNVKFKLDKCKISSNEVKYMGHIFTEQGIKLDADRVKSIVDMKPPKDKKELETFLGMITYVSRFIPSLATKNAVLRELTKKNVQWNWDENANRAFKELKETLCKAPVLQYYDVNKPVVLSVDASKSGLGAVLLQNGLPVAYASKALTQTEQRYAQIEKEALAIAFGCIKFDQQIYSKEILVESDHKPLEAIFKKCINDCPARLQSIRLRLQRYNLIVKYKPGKELFLADALSRAYSNCEKLDLEKEIETQVCLIMESFPISLDKKDQFVKETDSDEEMQLLVKYIQEGWPTSKSQVASTVKQYYNYSNELSVIDGLVFKGNRLVVPKNLRIEMLNLIHFNHLGKEKCKNRAREILFWPLMNKEIDDVVDSCAICNKHRKGNVKETLINREVPDGPWETLGVDIFYYQGSEFLLIIDYFSKYVEVAKLRDMSSSSVISVLKSQFARHGVPYVMYSDPGTQLNSAEMSKFAADWNFTWKTSSAKYSQSNGMVERHIATIKRMFKKLDDDPGKDPNLAMLEYRNTPIGDGLKSPNEIMFGRKIRGILPNSKNFEREKENREIKEKLIDRQLRQKEYYDRNAHNLKPVNVNDKVYVKKEFNKPMVPARVTKICDRPRSYEVELSNGNRIERNRRHLHGPVYENNCKDDCSNNNVQNNVNERTSENVSVSSPVKNVSVPVEASPKVNMRTRSGREVKKPEYLKDYVQ